MTSRTKTGWLVAILLLLYGLLSVLLGALQLGDLGRGMSAGAPVSEEVSIYFEHPVPITIHIVAGIVFNLFAPFQLVAPIRRKWPVFHRKSGKTLIVSGIAVALSGLWMNQFFPNYGGALKYTGVLAFGFGLMGALWLAYRSIHQGNVPRHRAWMLRSIAIGLGVTTQRVIVIPIFLLNGGVSELTVGLVVWAGLIVNLLVVEFVLCKEREIPTQLLLERSPS